MIVTYKILGPKLVIEQLIFARDSHRSGCMISALHDYFIVRPAERRDLWARVRYLRVTLCAHRSMRFEVLYCPAKIRWAGTSPAVRDVWERCQCRVHTCGLARSMHKFQRWWAEGNRGVTLSDDFEQSVSERWPFWRVTTQAHAIPRLSHASTETTILNSLT